MIIHSHNCHTDCDRIHSYSTESKRRLRVLVVAGVTATIVLALISLCIGSKTNIWVDDALSALISSMNKCGHDLTDEEMLIYKHRLPRAIAAITIGIGLSIAGAVYQAIIKNPLVEPYIMGVSSGAGTFVMAAMFTRFTFFGIFSVNDPIIIVMSAIVGGLLAFGCTMFIAKHAGEKSINYVLAGIVVGLIFSAIQSMLMIRTSIDVNNAFSWICGSFAYVSWDKMYLVLIPVITLSVIPLIWAEEFNLIVLGDDQATQMGMNVKMFNKMMLTIASILTAFCVAFCGIIGFIGLVIPHISRMLIGGDHRLVFPVSMIIGGSLLLSADLMSRTLLVGCELPVGIITTAIGVPIFAYLLIKRGYKYDKRQHFQI